MSRHAPSMAMFETHLARSDSFIQDLAPIPFPCISRDPFILNPVYVSSGSSAKSNPFVETTLGYALTYISQSRPSHRIDPVRLTVLADNDYYSQPSTTTTATPESGSISGHGAQDRFASFHVALHDAHKTGLGSSAALVTSLTAALLTHYLGGASGGNFDPLSRAGRNLLHNLAQAAHCAAQGKVGSGFDVAAAAWGGCRYRRFSPAVLSGLGEIGSPGFAARLGPLVEDHRDGSENHRNEAVGCWDAEIDTEASALPAGVAMRMCDVDCGSQTVGMVKKVLAWRAADPEKANSLWGELQRRNEELAAVLREGRLDEIRAALRGSRELVREMGTLSGVPIEPESQTELLDALEGIPGVYGGVVPGAGGFDALSLLVKDDEETASRIKEFLAAWSKENQGRVSLLDVKGEMEGLKLEKLETFQKWIN